MGTGHKAVDGRVDEEKLPLENEVVFAREGLYDHVDVAFPLDNSVSDHVVVGPPDHEPGQLVLDQTEVLA